MGIDPEVNYPQEGLRRLNLLTWCRIAPVERILAEEFRDSVPDEMWSQDAEEDGTPVAVIACPCGEQHVAPFCRITATDCGRFFANFGKRVKVARLPEEPVQADS